jgi:hypothetical protein
VSHEELRGFTWLRRSFLDIKVRGIRNEVAELGISVCGEVEVWVSFPKVLADVR